MFDYTWLSLPLPVTRKQHNGKIVCSNLQDEKMLKIVYR